MRLVKFFLSHLCDVAYFVFFWIIILVLLGSIATSSANDEVEKIDIFLVELSLNTTRSTDFYEVFRNVKNQLFVPVVPLFELGEATVKSENGKQVLELLPSRQSLIVDLPAHLLTINGQTRALQPDEFMFKNQTLFLNSVLLDQVFGLNFELSEAGQRLSIHSDNPWPVDLRLARERFWGQITNKQEDSAVPAVEIQQDYALWGAPQADVSLSYSDNRFNYSTLMVGELAYLTNQIFITGQNTKVANHRIRAGRTDPQGKAFGIAGLYNFQMGDIQSPLRLPLIGTGSNGKGALFQAAPLERPTNFDTTLIEGDALPGWDAELMSGNTLLDFMRIGTNGRYRFDNIPLGYGMNILRVVLHGPQGQTREIVHQQNIGSDMVPKGQVYGQGYAVRNAHEESYSGGFRFDYGFGKMLTAGGFVAQMPNANGSSSENAGNSVYSGIDMRTAISNFSIGTSFTLQYDQALSKNAQAANLRLLGGMGRIAVSTTHEQYGDGFHSNSNENGLVKALTKIRVSAPIVWKSLPDKQSLPANSHSLYVSASIDRNLYYNGATSVVPSLQLSHDLGAFAITHQFDYNFKSTPNLDGASPEKSREGDYRLIASLRRGEFDLRGRIERHLFSVSSWKTMSFMASYRTGKDIWSGNMSYVPGSSPVFGLHWNRDTKWAFLSTGFSYSQQSGAQLDIGLNFTLSGGNQHNLIMSSEYKATQGQANIKIFEEKPKKGFSQFSNKTLPVANANFSINQTSTEHSTDEQGETKLLGLPTYKSSLIMLDRDSLPNSFLVPLQPAVKFWSRPGQSIHIELPVTEGGEISGNLTLEHQQALIGLRVQVLNPAGQIHAETISLNDGYFMFDTVYPGTWKIQLAPAQKWHGKTLRSDPLTVTLLPNELQKTNIEILAHELAK